MDKLTYIKQEYPWQYRDCEQILKIVKQEEVDLSPLERKILLNSLINKLKDSLKKNLVNKLQKGKINQAYTSFLMTWIGDVVIEHNKLNVYLVKGDVVEVRDILQFPKPSFKFAFDKAACKINLEVLDSLVRKP